MSQFHSRKADFTGWWGGRRNGWEIHPVIFCANIKEEIHNEYVAFSVDEKTGTVTVLQDAAFFFEIWSRGRAPWDDIMVMLVKNMEYNGSGEPKFKGNSEWHKGNNRGHLTLEFSANAGCF